MSDKPSFVQRMFFNMINGELSLKNVLPIDCSNGEPKLLPKDRVLLLTNYKANIERGRKDKLQGKNVFAFPYDKGFFYMPVEEAEEALEAMFSYVTTVKKMLDAAK